KTPPNAPQMWNQAMSRAESGYVPDGQVDVIRKYGEQGIKGDDLTQRIIFEQQKNMIDQYGLTPAQLQSGDYSNVMPQTIAYAQARQAQQPRPEGIVAGAKDVFSRATGGV